MNIDIYSDRAKQAIQSAQSLALARRHQHLAPEHILKVLLEERDGLTASLAVAKPPRAIAKPPDEGREGRADNLKEQLSDRSYGRTQKA